MDMVIIINPYFQVLG